MTEPKDYEKQIKNFFFKFTIRTEGISYFTIVPLIVFNEIGRASCRERV